MTTRRTPKPQLPPADLEAEEVLLGLMILNSAARAVAVESVPPDDYYSPRHAHIATGLRDLEEAGESVDPILLHARLTQLGLAESISVADLIGLESKAPGGSAVRGYVARVTALALKRRLAFAGQEITEVAIDPTTSAEDAATEADARLALAAGPDPVRLTTFTVGEAAALAVERADAIERQGVDVAGIPTGHRDLDGITRRFEPASSVVVGSRPSMGKTAFALGMATHVARTGVPVLFFSLEMSAVEIGSRQIASLSGISGPTQRSGRMSVGQWERVHAAQAALADLPLVIDARGTLTTGDVRRRARAMQAQDGLALVVVDYLQLMTGRSSAERRELQVAELSRGLKVLAADLGIVVLVLSQLNRSLESRADKRPTLADLRESGAIEQDADVVMFIYRDEIYNRDSPDRGTAEIHIAKHRNGPAGHVRLGFLAETARFVDLAPDRELL